MPDASTAPHPAINPELLRLLTRKDGGRVVLIVGAGCSHEDPTALPLSRALSLDLHRQLVRHETLPEGDCPDPEDLSALSDAVVRRTGSQRALVECMDLNWFRVAPPNDGYLIAAALLREQAITSVLTLNFDLAMSSALTALEADDVGVINGPEQHHRLQTKNLIYLHRNVDSPPEQLVLTSDALETSWQGRWEEVITQRIVCSPAIVFAGLGSPATVLVHCVDKIHSAIPDQTLVIQVDPSPHGSSAFSQALGIAPDRHTAMGWSDFMRSLSRVLLEYWHDDIVEACKELAKDEGWNAEDITTLLRELHHLGIVACGQMRARWFHQRPGYLPWGRANIDWLADLLLVIRLIERETSSTAKLRSDGTVEFHSTTRLLGKLGVAHGRGSRSWNALEPTIRREYDSSSNPLNGVLVAGFTGVATESSPPLNIANEEPAESIVGGPARLRMVNAYDLRQNTTSVKDLW